MPQSSLSTPWKSAPAGTPQHVSHRRSTSAQRSTSTQASTLATTLPQPSPREPHHSPRHDPHHNPRHYPNRRPDRPLRVRRYRWRVANPPSQDRRDPLLRPTRPLQLVPSARLCLRAGRCTSALALALYRSPTSPSPTSPPRPASPSSIDLPNSHHPHQVRTGPRGAARSFPRSRELASCSTTSTGSCPPALTPATPA